MAAVVVAAASGPTPDGPHIPTRGKLLPLGVQFRFQPFDPSTELIGLVVVGCPVQEGDSTDDDGHGATTAGTTKAVSGAITVG